MTSSPGTFESRSKKPVDVLTKHRYMAIIDLNEGLSEKLSNGVPPPLIVSTFNGLQINYPRWSATFVITYTVSQAEYRLCIQRQEIWSKIIVIDCNSIIQTI